MSKLARDESSDDDDSFFIDISNATEAEEPDSEEDLLRLVDQTYPKFASDPDTPPSQSSGAPLGTIGSFPNHAMVECSDSDDVFQRFEESFIDRTFTNRPPTEFIVIPVRFFQINE